MKRTSDLVEILEANFGHRILIYYLNKKHQRPSSHILTRHLVHPSCLRCEKGMESHDNNMKTVKGRQTGTQRNFVKCLVWKRVLVEKKKMKASWWQKYDHFRTASLKMTCFQGWSNGTGSQEWQQWRQVSTKRSKSCRKRRGKE